MAAVILTAVVLWTIPTSDSFIDGNATHYAPGLMEQVAENRGRTLTGTLGGVALNRAGDLGRLVWLEWADGTVDGPYVVVDCAQRSHIEERERLRLVVEVDAQTAQRRLFYGVGPVPVRVWFIQPRPARWTAS